MPSRHTVSSFDGDLQQIEDALHAMGGRVEQALTRAARALEHRDEDLALEVIEADRVIDAMEEAINQNVVRLLALRQPKAQDLRLIIAVMKMADNLERLGDYSKNMAKRVAPLSAAQQIPGAGAAIRRQSKQVGQMLQDMLDAHAMHDVARAMDVIERDIEVDEMTNALFREFITHMMEDPRSITSCLHYIFIAKNVERMGDLVTSAAEQVVFLNTGAKTGERIKGRSTAEINLADVREGQE